MTTPTLDHPADSLACALPRFDHRHPTTDGRQALRQRDISARYAIARATLYVLITRGLWTNPCHRGRRVSFWPAYECEILHAARVAGRCDDDIRNIVRRLEAERAQALERAGWDAA